MCFIWVCFFTTSLCPFELKRKGKEVLSTATLNQWVEVLVLELQSLDKGTFRFMISCLSNLMQHCSITRKHLATCSTCQYKLGLISQFKQALLHGGNSKQAFNNCRQQITLIMKKHIFAIRWRNDFETRPWYFLPFLSFFLPWRINGVNKKFHKGRIEPSQNSSPNSIYGIIGNFWKDNSNEKCFICTFLPESTSLGCMQRFYIYICSKVFWIGQLHSIYFLYFLCCKQTYILHKNRLRITFRDRKKKQLTWNSERENSCKLELL